MEVRPFPFDLSAERALLGYMILNQNEIPIVLATLSEKDFYDQKHRQIFSVIRSNHADRLANDLVTVCAKLPPEAAGYAAKLVDAVPPGAVECASWARIVKEKSSARRFIMVSDKNSQRAQTEPIAPLLLLSVSEVLKISEEANERASNSEEVTAQTLAHAQRARQFGGALVGFSTGFQSLNHGTYGLMPGDLWTIAARTSIGKTSFAMNMASSLAMRSGVKVLFVSLEMSTQMVGMRLLSSLAKVPLSNLLCGSTSDYEMALVTEHATAVAAANNIFVCDSGNATLGSIEAAASSIAGLGAIFVDYLQLMEPVGRFGSRAEAISAIARGLKLIAMRLKIPVIAMSQLNRQVDLERRRPRLSDLRESGSIEQNSNVVVFLHRKEQDRFSGVRDGETDMIVAKNTRGPIGESKLWFDFATTTFTEN